MGIMVYSLLWACRILSISRMIPIPSLSLNPKPSTLNPKPIYPSKSLRQLHSLFVWGLWVAPWAPEPSTPPGI